MKFNSLFANAPATVFTESRLWRFFRFSPSNMMFILYYDQPRGLVVRASAYKPRGPEFDSRLYHEDFPCGGRIPVVTMVWVVSRIRFKVETSLTRSHTSINSWLNPRQRSPRWRGPHHERQPAHQLIEHPSTLIADYGREKKCCTM